MGKFEDKIERLKANDETLEKCQLSWAKIDDARAETLAHALDQHHTVTTLDLSSNTISDDGAQALALTLAAHPSIQSLELYNNQIKDYGMQSLAEALKYNHVLTILDLQSNFIGSDGIEFLADALLENTTLGYLDLGHNTIGNKGGKRLKEMMETNYIVAFLNLEGNHIKKNILADIKALVQRNFDMQKQAQAFEAKAIQATGSTESPSGSDAPPLRRTMPRQGSFGDEPVKRKVITILPTLYFLISHNTVSPDGVAATQLQNHTVKEKKIYAFFEKNLWCDYLCFKYVKDCPPELEKLLTAPFGDDQASNDFYYHVYIKLHSMLEACRIVYENADPHLLESSSNFAQRQHGLFSPLDAVGSIFEILSHYRTFAGQVSALHGVSIFVKRANGKPGGIYQVVENVARMATASKASKQIVARKKDKEFDSKRSRLLRRLGCNESLTPLKEEGCFLADRAIECIFEPKRKGLIEDLLAGKEIGDKGDEEEHGVKDALMADLFDLQLFQVDALHKVLVEKTVEVAEEKEEIVEEETVQLVQPLEFQPIVIEDSLTSSDQSEKKDKGAEQEDNGVSCWKSVFCCLGTR